MRTCSILRNSCSSALRERVCWNWSLKITLKARAEGQSITASHLGRTVGWDSGSVWYPLTTASLRCAASCYGITYGPLTILRLFLGLLIWSRQLQQGSRKPFSSECTCFACLLFRDEFWQPWNSLCSPDPTGTNRGPDASASLQVDGLKRCVLPHPASGSVFLRNSTVFRVDHSNLFP